MRKTVRTDKAPSAIAQYSQGIIAEGSLLFTAGQIALDPETSEIVGEDLETQAVQTLNNLKAVVEAAGSSLDQVIKVTIFLKNMDDYAKLNEIYLRYFSENPPARSAVEVSGLPKGVLVEIECIALIQ